MILKFKSKSGFCYMGDVFGIEVLDGEYTEKEAEDYAVEKNENISFYAIEDSDKCKIVKIFTKLDFDLQDEEQDNGLFAFFGETYLMNDNGKTIERIN